MKTWLPLLLLAVAAASLLALTRSPVAHDEPLRDDGTRASAPHLVGDDSVSAAPADEPHAAALDPSAPHGSPGVTPSPLAATPPPAASGAEVADLTGDVKERLDVAQYTYLRMATPNGEVWAALTKSDVRVGQRITVEKAVRLTGFHSKELNRDFAVVYFGVLAPAPKGPSTL